MAQCLIVRKQTGGINNLKKLNMTVGGYARGDNNGYPKTQEYSFNAIPRMIFLSVNCDRWTQANTLMSGKVEGLPTGSSSWEVLFELSKTGTQTYDSKADSLVLSTNKSYQKLRLVVQQGSQLYPCWANAQVLY